MSTPAPGSLAVHRISDEECVVAGSDGQLFRLAAGIEALRTREGRDVLEQVRAQILPAPPPSRGDHDVVVPSMSELTSCAEEIDTIAGEGRVMQFPYAGARYRFTLQPGSAVRSTALVTECLLSTLADADLAAALLTPPAHTIQSERNAEPLSAAPLLPPSPGVLQRWEDGWREHPFDPAPPVDPVTGLLKRLRRRPPAPPLPPAFVHLHAELPFLGSIDPRFQPDLLAPAGSLDTGHANDGALLEPGVLSGIAHYCGADLGQGERRRASARELAEDGQRWFDPREWEPHDPRLHDEQGFPFLPFDPDREREWILGHDDDGAVHVPTSLVQAGYARAGDDPWTVTNGNNLVGLQAGRTRSAAIESACAHVLAHDAVAVWWSSTAGAREVDLPQAVRAAWKETRLSVRILEIRSTFDIAVRLAVVDDLADTIVTLGFAADTDPDRAGELATIEALIQHASARDLAAPDSLIRDSAALGNGAVAGLATYSPQRRYATAFGDRYRGLIDPMAHIQYGLDPEIVSTVRRRTTPVADSRTVPGTDPVSAARHECGRLIVVDVATERVRAAGLHAVRVLLPGLARLQPAAFPLDPTGRLRRARTTLNWAAAERPGPYPGW